MMPYDTSGSTRSSGQRTPPKSAAPTSKQPGWHPLRHRCSVASRGLGEPCGGHPRPRRVTCPTRLTSWPGSRSEALEELDHGLHGGGGDQVPGIRQYREPASRYGAAGDRPLLDGAERIPVPGEDERWHGDGVHVRNGVAVRLGDPVEGLERQLSSSDRLPARCRGLISLARTSRPARGTARAELGVCPGCVGAAAEHLPRHGDGGCLRVRVEQVVSPVVHDRAH